MTPERIARVYAEQRAFMLAVAARHVGADAAEDCVQLAGMRMLSQHTRPPDERAWAYTLVHHEAHGLLDARTAQRRDARRTVGLEAARRATSPAAERTALDHLALVDACRRAPCAAALAAGYHPEEVAQMAGCSRAQVYRRVEAERAALGGDEPALCPLCQGAPRARQRFEHVSLRLAGSDGAPARAGLRCPTCRKVFGWPQ